MTIEPQRPTFSERQRMKRNAAKDRQMTVIDWEAAKQRLHFIANGAEMASRNARALPFKPSFRTAAHDELEDAEAVLERALQLIREAMAEINSKETA